MSKNRITLAELAEQMREVREGLFALRADLSGIMKDAQQLAKQREKNRLKMAARRAAVSTQRKAVSTHERKEGERENSPHTPYREKEGERKDVCVSSTGARVREDDPMNFTPPYAPADNDPRTDDDPIHPCTFAQLLDAAKTYRPRVDEAYVRDVYNKFVASGWRDVKGKAFNPCGLITAYLDNRKRFERLQDPDRIPDARKGGRQTARRHADNWLNRPLQEGDDVL